MKLQLELTDEEADEIKKTGRVFLDGRIDTFAFELNKDTVTFKVMNAGFLTIDGKKHLLLSVRREHEKQ